MISARNKHAPGFTLIEVLVAIFVLAIGIFGVMALFPAGIRQTDKIAKTTIGTISAELPLAHTSYKYPAGNTSGANHSLQDIVGSLSGTNTPACYFYPPSGVGTITGNSLYGWTTAIVPIDMDTPGNGTATTIGETYLFRTQVAVYKNYATASGTATFAYGTTTVSNVSNVTGISTNGFICNTQNHIWYRVTDVNTSAGKITLKQPYEYQSTTSAPYIATDKIIGIYNSMMRAGDSSWGAGGGGGGGSGSGSGSGS